MALQFRRGTEAQRASTGITPASGELIHCTDSGAWYGGDGVTTGGRAMPGAIGQHAITAPAADGVLAFDGATQRWAAGVNLADLGDVDGQPYGADLVVWDAGEGIYRSGLPDPSHRPIIVAAQDAALPTIARPGTLWTRGPVSDGLFFCVAAGPPATWEQIPFVTDSSVSGFARVMTAAIDAGAASVPVAMAGFDITVAIAMDAGAASAPVDGFALSMSVSMSAGDASAGSGAPGLDLAITASLSAGAGSGVNPISVGSITYSQSSVYSGTTAANNSIMTDGSVSNTGAATNTTAPEWIQMDLGAVFAVGKVIIGTATSSIPGGWSRGYTSQRPVEYSSDGSSWTEAFTTPIYDSDGIYEYTVDFSARYIRIRGNYTAMTEFYALSPGQSYP